MSGASITTGTIAGTAITGIAALGTQVVLGTGAGGAPSGLGAVAVGYNAGVTGSDYIVAIGYQCALSGQAARAVAVGYLAGTTSQGIEAVSLGYHSGWNTQGNYAVGIGSGAGSSNQGTYGVGIGYGAGGTNQGAYSIAIGYNGGVSNQFANSIILNASGASLNNSTVAGFICNPVRSVAGTTPVIMAYDTTNSEIIRATSAFAPAISGANITSGTIPIASVVGTAMDLTTAQTVAGIKTFSSAPVMSGASITSATIPNASLVSSVPTLGGTQAANTFTTGIATPAIKISTSPTSGYLLTSDASGNGTWAAAPGPVLTYQSGSAFPSTLFTTSSTVNLSSITLTGGRTYELYYRLGLQNLNGSTSAVIAYCLTYISLTSASTTPASVLAGGAINEDGIPKTLTALNSYTQGMGSLIIAPSSTTTYYYNALISYTGAVSIGPSNTGACYLYAVRIA